MVNRKRKKRRRRVRKGAREIQHRARETAAAPMKPPPPRPRAGPISKRRQARGPATILSGVLGAVGGLFGLWLPEILAYNVGADLVFSDAIYGACVECSSLGVLLGAIVGILGARFFKFSGFPLGLQSFLTGFLVSFLLWALFFVLATT